MARPILAPPCRKARWPRRSAALLCLLSVSVAPARARAAGPENPSTAQARQEVLTALAVGNPGHAEEILDRAFRSDPDPSLLYQLGLVAQAQGRTVAALDLYRRYQDTVGASIEPTTNSAIETFAASVTAPVTVLNVISTPGMLLSMDDKIVGTLPLRTPVLLAGGTHRFRIERRSEHYESGTFSIPDGREADLRLTPGTKGTAVATLSLSPISMLVISSGSAQPAVVQNVQKALAEAARKNHLAPLPPSRLALLLSKRTPTCLENADCQFAVAEQAQARSILKARVKLDADRDASTSSAPSRCAVELEYLDVNAGQRVGTASTELTDCEGQPLTDALATVIQAHQTAADGRSRGMISVSSVPEGAEVRVDGLLRGPTPYLRASFSGMHEILVEKANYQLFRSRVEVTLGQVATVQAPLQELPPEEREPPPAALRIEKLVWVERQRPRPRWRLVAGGIGAGGGVLLTGFGISALSINGQCSQGPMPGGICDASYATSAVGASMLSVGVALSVAGVVMLALPGRRERIQESVYFDAEPSAQATGPKE